MCLTTNGDATIATPERFTYAIIEDGGGLLWWVGLRGTERCDVALMGVIGLVGVDHCIFTSRWFILSK